MFINDTALIEGEPRTVPGTPLPLAGMPESIPTPSRMARVLRYGALALFGSTFIGLGLSTSLIYGDWMVALCSLPILLTATVMVSLLGYFMFMQGSDLNEQRPSDAAR
jgi:hypothetical protein